MKRLKIFPKIFFYSLGIMLLIAVAAHLLFYLLAPKMAIEFMPDSSLQIGGIILSSNINPMDFLMQTIQRTLPISLSCCVLISVICSYLFQGDDQRSPALGDGTNGIWTKPQPAPWHP
ncbi:MAG: hypothetical protein ACLSB9_26285 [Hydrogeniiclostridium mannosilyticum]